MQIQHSSVKNGEKLVLLRKEVKIRSLKTGDYEALFELDTSLFEESKTNPIIRDSGIISLSEPPKSDIYAQLAREAMRTAVISVAEIDGIAIGISNITSLAVSRFNITHQDVGELSIKIKSDYRNIGIGKELLRDVLERASESNIFTVVELMVSISNEPAVNLYKKFGFCIQESSICSMGEVSKGDIAMRLELRR